MPIKLSQKGFSLPEITVALGLLGGISLMTIKLVENQMNNEAHLKAKTEIAKTTALLKTILNDPENCRNMLKDQILPTATGSGVRTNIGLPPALPAPSLNPALPGPGLYQRIKNPGTSPATYAYKEILLATGNYRNFGVGYIQFEKMTDSNTPAKIMLSGVSTDIDMDTVDLIIQYRVETKSILFKSTTNDANEKGYLQRIPLLATFNYNTNQIKDCGMVTGEATVAAKQKFCTSLGNMAQWDATALTCKFKPNVCPAGQVPEAQSKVNASTFTCVPVTDQFDAEDLFDTTATCQSATGSYTIQVGASGKLRIQCN